MSVRDYICVDIEATGIGAKKQKIIEIGAVKVINHEIAEVFQSLVQPGRRLDERIVELTGISDQDLLDAPRIEELFPRLKEFMGEYPLLGHSVIHDYGFIKKVYVDQRQEYERRGIDTLAIAKKCLPELEHWNLGYLCSYYGIEHKPHRAYQDAYATKCLYDRLREKFEQDHGTLFEPKPLQYKLKRDVPATKHQKERLYMLCQLHRLTLKEDIEQLTKSEASRITDQIYSAYGRILQN